MASSKQTIQLLKDKRPTSCFIDQIYDPDKDGPWSDDESFPRVIPSEGAIAIDRESHVIYVVTYVDPVTYKSTIAPITTMTEHDSSSGNDSNVIKVLSYGNDRFTLFVNKDHKPTQLTISSNFVVFGHDLVKYQLYRYAKDGTREVISIYLDSDEEYRGEYHTAGHLREEPRQRDEGESGARFGRRVEGEYGGEHHEPREERH